VSIVVGGLEEFVDQSSEDAPFRIRFPCRRIDTQVTCAARISTVLAPILSSVERLHLEYYATRWQRGFLPEIPREAWFELLRPFSNVQKLQLDTATTRQLSFALCPEDGPPAEGVLPKLSKLLRPHHALFEGMLDPFIAAREAAGQPISKRRCPPTSDSESEDELWWLLASDEEVSTELDSDSEFDFDSLVPIYPFPFPGAFHFSIPLTARFATLILLSCLLPPLPVNLTYCCLNPSVSGFLLYVSCPIPFQMWPARLYTLRL